MYSIKLYTNDFASNLTNLFHSYDFYDFQWRVEINKAGSMEFVIPVNHEKATATNLALFNKVIVEKDGIGKFIGYIENLQVDTEEIQVKCVGMLGFFEKRLYTASISSADIDTTMFAILTATNSAGATGISNGTSTGVSGAITSMDFSRSSVLDAWQKIANFGDIEFEIDTDRNFNLYTEMGVDKSDSIFLRYNTTQLPTATILEFDVEVDGGDMANSVTGIRDGGSTASKTDATSIAAYGLLEESKNFAQTANATDLETETQNYLDTSKNEFYSPKITLNPNYITESDIDLGDTVSVQLFNGFINVDLEERIIKKTVSVGEDGMETVSLELLPTTTNKLPSTFLDDIVDLEKRLKLVEGAI